MKTGLLCEFLPHPREFVSISTEFSGVDAFGMKLVHFSGT
jgi:hypothetical protein